jgi:hypothetical protein
MTMMVILCLDVPAGPPSVKKLRSGQYLAALDLSAHQLSDFNYRSVGRRTVKPSNDRLPELMSLVCRQSLGDPC